MIGKQRALIVVGCAGLALSGCVAAVIPLAASGMIGGSKLRHDKARADARRGRTPVAPAPAAAAASTTTAPAASTTAASTPTAASAPDVPPVPTDRSTMKVGQTYRGDLPPPTGTASVAAVPVEAAGRSPASNWTDVMHFAATASLQRPTASALLARGSSITAPHWAPCGDKPLAVLVDLPATVPSPFFDGAMDNLKAIETMGLTLVYASDQPAAIAAQRRMLKAGGVTPPVAGTTAFAGAAAATRATIAGQYCVVAVVGSRAGDFPNATLPGAAGANAGWFLIP